MPPVQQRRKHRQKTIVIRQFITEMVDSHPSDIAKVTADHFGVTPQAVRMHLKALEDDGALKATGNTRARQYELCAISQINRTYETKGLQEDVPWSEDFKPHLGTLPKNVVDLCSIAFTELLNNAIDHAESEFVSISMLCTAATVKFRISDAGIGIFRKVRKALGLREDREAILELAKGKFTTDPSNHTGYGIFFSSRMVDVFSLRSGDLLFTHIQPDSDWLVDDQSPVEGTLVEFTVSTHTDRTTADVYNAFCADMDEDMTFSKTHVPIRLAQYGTERLVSRSQAKRVLTRFERFQEVLLDFANVEFIGQGFADEIFRVFPASHPDVKIVPINANRQVTAMIQLSLSENRNPQMKLF